MTIYLGQIRRGMFFDYLSVLNDNIFRADKKGVFFDYLSVLNDNIFRADKKGVFFDYLSVLNDNIFRADKKGVFFDYLSVLNDNIFRADKKGGMFLDYLVARKDNCNMIMYLGQIWRGCSCPTFLPGVIEDLDVLQLLADGYDE